MKSHIASISLLLYITLKCYSSEIKAYPIIRNGTAGIILPSKITLLYLIVHLLILPELVFMILKNIISSSTNRVTPIDFQNYKK